MQQRSAQPLPPHASRDTVCVMPVPSCRAPPARTSPRFCQGKGRFCGTQMQQDAVAWDLLPPFAPGSEFPGIQDCMQARLPLGEAQGDL